MSLQSSVTAIVNAIGDLRAALMAQGVIRSRDATGQTFYMSGRPSEANLFTKTALADLSSKIRGYAVCTDKALKAEVYGQWLGSILGLRNETELISVDGYMAIPKDEWNANSGYSPVAYTDNGGVIQFYFRPNGSNHSYNDVGSLLTSIGVTVIHSYAFYGHTGLSSVSIPATVTSVGEYAFATCSSLSSVTITSGTNYIAASAFSGTPATITFNMPDRTCAEVYAMTNFPFGVSSSATFVCKNGKLYPNGTTVIDDDDYTPGEGVSLDNHTVRIASDSAAVASQMYKNNQAVYSVENNSATFKEYASECFSGCQSLTSLIEGGGATNYTVGFMAFYGDDLLTSIPKNFSRVEGYAFYGCKLITGSLVFPYCTYIGSEVFNSALTSVTASLCSYIGSSAFKNITTLTTARFPSVVEIANDAFSGCTSLSSFTGFNTVTRIGSGAFAGCTALQTLSLPSIQTIGGSAFSGCTNLSVTLDAGIANAVIGGDAFSGVRTTVLPNNITFPALSERSFFGANIQATNLTVSALSCPAGAFRKIVTRSNGVASNGYIPSYSTASHLSYLTWDSSYSVFITSYQHGASEAISLLKYLINKGVVSGQPMPSPDAVSAGTIADLTIYNQAIASVTRTEVAYNTSGRTTFHYSAPSPSQWTPDGPLVKTDSMSNPTVVNGNVGQAGLTYIESFFGSGYQYGGTVSYIPATMSAPYASSIPFIVVSQAPRITTLHMPKCTRIGSNAMQYYGGTTVYVPKVTTILKDAFVYSKISHVVFGDNEIEQGATEYSGWNKYAFRGANISAITLPYYLVANVHRAPLYPWGLKAGTVIHCADGDRTVTVTEAYSESVTISQPQAAPVGATNWIYRANHFDNLDSWCIGNLTFGFYDEDWLSRCIQDGCFTGSHIHHVTWTGTFTPTAARFRQLGLAAGTVVTLQNGSTITL